MLPLRFYFSQLTGRNLSLGVPTVALWASDPACLCGGLVPSQHSGLRIWRCCNYGIGGSCSLDSIPGLGTSMCLKYSRKRKGKKRKKSLPRHRQLTPPGPPGCPAPRTSPAVSFQLVSPFSTHYPGRNHHCSFPAPHSTSYQGTNTLKSPWTSAPADPGCGSKPSPSTAYPLQ